MSLSEPLLGVAALSRMAFAGADLSPLLGRMNDRMERDPEDANALMDLSVILQLLSKPQLALILQERALRLRQIYHLPAPVGRDDIRLLAIMTRGDLMANTPLDFMLEGSAISLDMVYVTPDMPLPEVVPDHDVVFVAVGVSEANLSVLRQLHRQMQFFHRPVLNVPMAIAGTTREATWETLKNVDGVEMPPQLRLGRRRLEGVIRGEELPEALGREKGFPLVVRPIESHAGRGLARVTSVGDLRTYLDGRWEREFYLSPFVDYRGCDGLYRKYRIVIIDGTAFASHMAISNEWMVHYLNAGMTENVEKRREEELFMVRFETDFRVRHANALTAIYRRIGLDYLVIDCAEMPTGRLLVFEVDAGAIVHAMDPIDLFPYKHVQMRKVFNAFQNMLARRCGVTFDDRS